MRRPARGEDGGALILALVFLLVVALFVLPMVTFLDVGQRTTVPLRDARSRALAVDGAVDAAIHRFRLAGCADHLAPAQPDGKPLADQEMLVRCTAEGGGGSTATPPQALLALGDSGEESGVTSTSGNLRVRGSVFSRSPRLGATGSVHAAGSGSLLVNGRVSALGDCTPPAKVRASQGRQCANDPGGPADPVRGRDPDYGRSPTTVPAPGAVTEGDPPAPVVVPAPGPDPPACPAARWRVDVWPGYFDDPTLLNLLTGPTCRDRVVWLHPGDYHLNFGFRGAASAADTTWTVDEPTVNVVGGTPRGDWPDQAAKPSSFPVPGACKGDEAPGAGVQLVLGGGSRLDVKAGQVELCASERAGDQRIALYGEPGPKPVHTLAPGAVAASAGFTTPEGALLIGEAGADHHSQADLDPARPQASLTVGVFRPFVPAEAVIDSAVLRVAHHDVGAMDSVSVSLSPARCGGPKDLDLRPDGLGEGLVDLKAECGLTTGIPFLGRGCAGGDCLTVTYTATASAAGIATAVLDGMWIDVAYREPVTRKPGGAVIPATGDRFTGHADALQIGERPTAVTASADLTPAEPTASLTLTGYGEPPLQAGSRIDHAVLRVAHREEGDVGSVTVTVPGACGTPGPRPLTVHPGLETDAVDLKACGLVASDLPGFTVTLTAGLDGSGTAGAVHVDGIWLDLVAGPPPPQRALHHDDGAGGFTTAPGNVLAIDGASAEAALGPGAPSAAMTVGSPDGFGVALPRGAEPVSARLLIAHRADSPDVAPVATVRVSDDGGATDCLPETEPVEVGLGALSTSVQPLPPGCDLRDPSLLTVTYRVALGPGGTTATGHLDGIELDLRYQPAAVRPPAGHDGGAGGFTDPGNALSVDGSSALALLDGAADPPVTGASITVGGFGAPVPAGSRLESAFLRVAHRDDSNDDVPLVVTVRGSTDGGTTFCLPDTPLATSPGALGTDTLDLLGGACDLGDPSALVVTYTAVLGEGGTGGAAALDGIEVDLHFRPPAFEAVAGCAAQGPYPPADPAAPDAACALVKVSPGAGPAFTRFVVQGTVYVPTGAFDVSLADVGAPVVTRGIVARTIRLGTVPATTRALVSVPPESALFEVHRARSLRPAQPEGVIDARRGVDGTFDPSLATVTEGTPLELSGYGTPSDTYAGAPILRVRHKDSGVATEVQVVVNLSDTVTVTFSSNDGPCQLCLSGGALVEDHLALEADDNGNPVTPERLDGATVRFEVVAPAGGTAELDGIEIVEVLSGPVVRARVEFAPDRPAAVVAWSVLP